VLAEDKPLAVALAKLCTCMVTLRRKFAETFGGLHLGQAFHQAAQVAQQETLHLQAWRAVGKMLNVAARLPSDDPAVVRELIVPLDTMQSAAGASVVKQAFTEFWQEVIGSVIQDRASKACKTLLAGGFGAFTTSLDLCISMSAVPASASTAERVRSLLHGDDVVFDGLAASATQVKSATATALSVILEALGPDGKRAGPSATAMVQHMKSECLDLRGCSPKEAALTCQALAHTSMLAALVAAVDRAIKENPRYYDLKGAAPRFCSEGLRVVSELSRVLRSGIGCGLNKRSGLIPNQQQLENWLANVELALQEARDMICRTWARRVEEDAKGLESKLPRWQIVVENGFQDAAARKIILGSVHRASLSDDVAALELSMELHADACRLLGKISLESFDETVWAYADSVKKLASQTLIVTAASNVLLDLASHGSAPTLAREVLKQSKSTRVPLPRTWLQDKGVGWHDAGLFLHYRTLRGVSLDMPCTTLS
jgi:hypothetical protein